MSYQAPFSFGPLHLPNNIFYAPLSGCSDAAFRKMASFFQPGLIFCEMVKIEGLLYRNAQTLSMLKNHANIHPIGVQLCGSHPQKVKEAVKIVSEMGFDLIDLNCGCPVPKITKDGSGAALLSNLSLLEAMLVAIKESTALPVTLKIRTGWDHEKVAFQILSLAEEIGFSAITIHGRTRAQRYEGAADWEIIHECKKRAKKILVIGNGDVTSHEKAKELFSVSSCDGIMIGRSALSRPWIVEEIRQNKTLAYNFYKLLLRHFQIYLEEEREENLLYAFKRTATSP